MFINKIKRSSLIWVLFLLNLFTFPPITLALTEDLVDVPSVRVHNTAPYLSGVIDASTYETLNFSFTFDATTLDFGPPQDSFVYGWKVDGSENILGSFVGLAGADPLEIVTVALDLPSGAKVNNLQIFMQVIANSTQSSDKVEITNLKLTGTKPDPIDLCPNLDGLQENLPPSYHFEDGLCIEDTPPPVDLCPNLVGVQEVLPEGFQITVDGNCELIPPPPTDVCPNLAGLQSSLPDGYSLEGGNCLLVDVCQNLEGVQGTLPPGYQLVSAGVCESISTTTPPVDLCSNLTGIQITVPEGYVLSIGGNCLEETPSATDICLNLEGVQATVPVGYEISGAGMCALIATTTPLIDLCLNLEGVQSTVPDGYIGDVSLNCTEIILPIDLCPNIVGIQEVVPIGFEINTEATCVPKVEIVDDKPSKGGGGGGGKKGTRIQKFYQKAEASCPTGYAKWIDRFRPSHVWVADDVYKEIILVGGPKPGQRNRDGSYFFKISGPTEVGDKYFRRFHKIDFVCVK